MKDVPRMDRLLARYAAASLCVYLFLQVFGMGYKPVGTTVSGVVWHWYGLETKGVLSRVTPDAIPYGLLSLPFAALPILWIHRRATRRRRAERAAAAKVCFICGYDLRASKDRCPECGTPFRTPCCLLIGLLLLCSCGHDTAVTHGVSSTKPAMEMPPDSVGRLAFGVGGASNRLTREFKSDPAYRPFFVAFVEGKTSRCVDECWFVIGTESSEAAAIMRVLDRELPSSNVREDNEVFVNHIVFEGDIGGRRWLLSRTYPDPTVDRIVRSIWLILDGIPCGALLR